MTFEATPEQALLDDTVGRLLDRHYSARDRAAIIGSESGWDAGIWQRFADLGLLGLHLDESVGGAGMTLAETAVVMRAFGRALVVEPYLPTVVLGAGLVARCGSPAQRSRILPQVASGQLRLGFAHHELGPRWSGADVTILAEPHGDDWTLTGQKIAVLGGSCADEVLVSARTPDGELGIFLVDVDATVRDGYRTQDDRPAADISFAGSAATALATDEVAASAIKSVLDDAAAMLCAETIGVQERALDLTLDYLRTREQFGRSIGSFQSVQFRAADMYVSVEMARSMLHMALGAVAPLHGRDDGTAGSDDRRRWLTSAQLVVNESGRHVTHEAVQLHGGIGMTTEHPIGHYLKRSAVNSRILGSSDDLVGRLLPAASPPAVGLADGPALTLAR